MPNYNRLDEKKFNTVKILLNGGATHKQAAEIAGLATATVARISEAETYTDYHNKWHKQDTPHTLPPQVIVNASHYMNEELRNANETLRLIKNVLTALYEELTGTKGGGD